MTIKSLTMLAFVLLFSGTVFAQSGSQGSAGARESRIEARQERREARQERREERRANGPRPTAVPELDGGMAFLVLGLVLAAGALIRENRRPR